jgi:hypothetical protein
MRRRAFDFHHRGTRFADQSRAGLQRVGDITVAHEREVGHQQRGAQAAGNGSGVVDHVLQRHRQRAGVPLHHHAQRVADQRHIHPGRFELPGKTGVVGGKHDDALARGLHGAQAGNGDRLAVWSAGILHVQGQCPGHSCGWRNTSPPRGPAIINPRRRSAAKPSIS